LGIKTFRPPSSVFQILSRISGLNFFSIKLTAKSTNSELKP